VKNVLLGMPGRNQQMDFQTFSTKIDTKFSFSDFYGDIVWKSGG
jgi:hypothetical protein